MTTSIDTSYTSPDPIDTNLQSDRPEWLPEKFKTVEDAAKSYLELEKRVGSAPNEYDTSKAQSWFDGDYVPFQEMLDVAKAKHVSQDVMDKMFESVGKYLDEFKIDPRQEKAKLGPDADARIQTLDNWAKSNFSKETYQALMNSAGTAEAFKAIEEVRNKMNSSVTQIPGQTSQDSANAPSLQDIQSELNKNLDKYKTDPAYRREIQAKIELASKSSGFQDKQAY
jgi:hypothetical protein